MTAPKVHLSMPRAAPASGRAGVGDAGEVERALQGAVFARPPVGRENDRVELEATVPPEPPPTRRTRRRVPSRSVSSLGALRHAVEEGLGLDVARRPSGRRRSWSSRCRRRRRPLGQLAQRLQPGQNRDVVLGRRAPEEHARSSPVTSPRRHRTSRVVVGQVVEVENAVAGHAASRAPTRPLPSRVSKRAGRFA